MTYSWEHLTRPGVGRCGADLIKKEFSNYGFTITSSEKRGNSNRFTVSFGGGPSVAILPRTSRLKNTYIFMSKEKNVLSPRLYMAICMLKEMEKPRLYLIPSLEWKNPDALLVSRDFEKKGQKSRPEWGVNISGKTRGLLQDKYKLSEIIKKLGYQK